MRILVAESRRVWLRNRLFWLQNRLFLVAESYMILVAESPKYGCRIGPLFLHSTLYTVHSTLYTPYLLLHTLHFTPHTLHSTPDTLHFTLRTPHFTLHTPHSHTLHFALYTPHFTFSTQRSTLYTPHFILPFSPRTTMIPGFVILRVGIRVRGLHLVWGGSWGLTFKKWSTGMCLEERQHLAFQVLNVSLASFSMKQKPPSKWIYQSEN